MKNSICCSLSVFRRLAISLIGIAFLASAATKPDDRLTSWPASEKVSMILGDSGPVSISVEHLAPAKFDTYSEARMKPVALGNLQISGDECWDAQIGSIGMNNAVLSVAVSGVTVYAGGDFTTAGGVSANHIARWDGTTWSALGSGLDRAVCAIAVCGSDVYAGGTFTNAGGVPASCIAKWNGSTWVPLLAGTNNTVLALAVIGTAVYAGGTFTTAGGIPANHIAKWDGANWSALGTGVNQAVRALAVLDNTLYAGGSFWTAGGVAANYVAKWDGSNWSALGAGMNFYVHALAASGSTLYAGGEFLYAEGKTANRIAKWDGTSWTPLGSGLNSFPLALVTSGKYLYAGGWFTTAGGGSANHISRWDGTSWAPLGSGTNQQVIALASNGSDIYAGGEFTSAGARTSNHVAEWHQPGRRLQVPYYGQFDAPWCWAASLSMLLKFYGYDRRIYEIAADFGWQKTTGNSPLSSQMTNWLNQGYGNGHNDTWVTENYSLFVSDPGHRDTFISKIRGVIDSGNPIWLGKPGAIVTSGHSIVITGYDEDNVYVHDPSGALFYSDPDTLTNIQVEWNSFLQKLASFLQEDCDLIYAKPGRIIESHGVVSLEVGPGMLAFENSFGFSGGSKRSLHIDWDGQTHSKGYFYVCDDTGWYLPVYDIDYMATQADVLQLTATVANYTSPLSAKNGYILVEIRTLTGELILSDTTGMLQFPEDSSRQRRNVILGGGELSSMKPDHYKLNIILKTDDGNIQDTNSYHFWVSPSDYSGAEVHCLSPIQGNIVVGSDGIWKFRIKNTGSKADSFNLNADAGGFSYLGTPIWNTPLIQPGAEIDVEFSFAAVGLNVGANGTVQVRFESNNDASIARSITVSYLIIPSQAIIVTSPNGGENWLVGSSRTITWTSTGAIANVKIECSTDSGADYYIIVASTANSRSYSWTVANSASPYCVVKVSDALNSYDSDASDLVFSIKPMPIWIPHHAVGNIDGDSKKEAAVDFGTLGIYLYDDGTWTQLSSANAESLLAVDIDGDLLDEIIADLGSGGLWLWNASAWSQLSGINLDCMAASDVDGDGRAELVGDFGIVGMWLYNPGSWTQLSGVNADFVITSDLDATGGTEIIGDFGDTGLWLWNSGVWTQLSGVNADYVTAGKMVGANNLVGDFGATGLWQWSKASGWIQLSGVNSDFMIAANTDGDADDEIAGDFGAVGLWLGDGNSWTQLSGINAEFMVAADIDDSGSQEIATDFGALGLWLWNASSWAQISGVNAEYHLAADLDGDNKDEILADYGALGLWLWNEGSWIQISANNPD